MSTLKSNCVENNREFKPSLPQNVDIHRKEEEENTEYARSGCAVNLKFFWYLLNTNNFVSSHLHAHLIRVEALYFVKITLFIDHSFYDYNYMVHTYTYIQSYLYTCAETHTHTCINACMHAYIHTYICMYLYICV